MSDELLGFTVTLPPVPITGTLWDEIDCPDVTIRIEAIEPSLVMDYPRDEGGGIDIGAMELGVVPTVVLACLVDPAEDECPGVCISLATFFTVYRPHQGKP